MRRRAGRQFTRFAMTAVLLLAAVAVAVLHSPAARAEENPLYTITGVEVDVQADTAADAKRQAITEANVKAFSLFASRVGAGEAALGEIAKLPPKQIDAMLNTLSIEEERTGPGRYIARLTIRFLPDKVRSLMNRLGVSYSEKVASGQSSCRSGEQLTAHCRYGKTTPGAPPGSIAEGRKCPGASDRAAWRPYRHQHPDV